MSDYIKLRRITFKGPKKEASLVLKSGVNVICGASDTGKSFLAESLDFMLGGSKLREIPERSAYGKAELDFVINSGKNWRLERATSGGNFCLFDMNVDDPEAVPLIQAHVHEKTNNLSGFLLEKIELLGKRILKSSVKGTTQSLSFRNLARLVIVQEGEIQQTGSPFWGGQYTLKTVELAAIKLLLTGVDDSSVVTVAELRSDSGGQVAMLDELLFDLEVEIADLGESHSDLTDQLDRLETSIEKHKETLNASQCHLDGLLSARRELFVDRQASQGRLDEISSLLTRFTLLGDHYSVDVERLTAIKESGSMFAHVEAVSCPLCGANPEAQHLGEACDGDVEAIVAAASAEISKIKQLQIELASTVSDLEREKTELSEKLSLTDTQYRELDLQIQQTVAPEVSEIRSSFSSYVEERSKAQKSVELFYRADILKARKVALEIEEAQPTSAGRVATGLPDSVAHNFSMRVSAILKAWDFPGDCRVHFDKETTDFVIDGKPRGNRGKGLRAITHAAVTISLLEFCQENELSHPGFVVLDSPLLAYFKPEGDDDKSLRGTDLKKKFYEYLIKHHGKDSQVIIIENQHPPNMMLNDLEMTVFTGNPNKGRQGFL